MKVIRPERSKNQYTVYLQLLFRPYFSYMPPSFLPPQVHKCAKNTSFARA